MILDLARLLVFPALMAFAAASDLFTMTISNRVSILLAAAFLLLAVATGMGPYAILSHLGAGALVLMTAFGCFAMGWVGGGDAKVAAAAALWFGFGHLLNYLLYASLFGGALADTFRVEQTRHFFGVSRPDRARATDGAAPQRKDMPAAPALAK